MLTDQAFTDSPQLDVYLNATPLKHVFLHELAHIYDYDNGNVSYSSEFAVATGWTVQSHGGVFSSSGPNVPNLPADAVDQNNEQMRALFSEGKFFEGVVLTHSFGTQYGYSSGYGMTNPFECFAELVSWTYSDKSARQYLPPAAFGYVSAILK